MPAARRGCSCAVPHLGVACVAVALDPRHEETSDRLARRALFGFALTFVGSRAKVFLIWGFLVLALAVVGFGAVILISGNHIGHLVGPRLRELELNSSP